jgi:hypothetical protein
MKIMIYSFAFSSPEFGFDFSNDCLQAFNLLKEKFISAPIICALDWELPFELVFDASDCAIEVVLRQQKDIVLPFMSLFLGVNKKKYFYY